MRKRGRACSNGGLLFQEVQESKLCAMLWVNAICRSDVLFWKNGNTGICSLSLLLLLSILLVLCNSRTYHGQHLGPILKSGMGLTIRSNLEN
ncbi:hypothetical protein VNO80_10969 [Phaseolus coccineus]|uniref:Uncharacterized protein n=1 Tax=Phaseolus coccineus TaxID=3886 RepID=A0AAN9NAR9_PHACN